MPVEHTSGTIVNAAQSVATRSALVAWLNTQLQNAGWTSTAIANGFKLTSAQTPQYLQMKVWIVDNSETSGSYGIVRIRVSNYTEDKISAASVAASSAVYVLNTGTLYNLVANRHQFFLYTLGAYTQFQWFATGVPFLPTPHVPKLVSSATSASPIVVTSNAHGYSNGDLVYITGVEGLTGINGITHTVANKTTNTFELSGSVGGATYTSGGVIGKVPGQVAEAIWMCDGGNASWGVLRNRINGAAGITWSTLNGNTVAVNGATGTLNIAHTQLNYKASFADMFMYNGSFAGSEPLVALSTSSVLQSTVVGQLWDAFVITGDIPYDVNTDAPLDGSHNYTSMCYFDGAANCPPAGLMVATS